jgi:cation-transporting ATPase 13A1
VKTLAEFRNLIGKSSLVCTSSVSLLPPDFLPYIAIFARTSPSEKEYIVKKLKELEGKEILYAGDGTNDVGGLRAADVGIAVVGLSKLSEVQQKEEQLK